MIPIAPGWRGLPGAGPFDRFFPARHSTDPGGPMLFPASTRAWSKKQPPKTTFYHPCPPSVEDLSSHRVCLKLGLPDRQVVGPIIGRAGGMTMKA